MTPPLHAIAALSENRAIGFEGKIPWHLPLDFRWFKHKTMGGSLIMGRKTLESLGRPLPGRTCYVLSRREAVAGTKSYADLDPLLAALPGDTPAWVGGGAEIYRQLLPACTHLYLTRVKRTTPGDVFFPPFEDQFDRDQVIHENDDFRVERWRRHDAMPLPPEAWPFD